MLTDSSTLSVQESNINRLAGCVLGHVKRGPCFDLPCTILKPSKQRLSKQTFDFRAVWSRGLVKLLSMAELSY